MKEYLSITEMAKRRSITTETLRYYDRIGLLKPDYLDSNRVRYYSVLKYEELETIKELQQLGLDLKEIAKYLDKRNLKSSYSLLLKQNDFCQEKIKYYKALNEKIKRKTELLNDIKKSNIEFFKPSLIKQEKRICLSSSNSVSDEVSLAYACMELESEIKAWDKLAPIYGSDCYAGLFNVNSDDLKETQLVFILKQKNKISEKCSIVLSEGNYLHLYTNGSFWDREKVKDCLLSYARENGLVLSEEIIVISKVDYSITDIPEERTFEFQARVVGFK